MVENSTVTLAAAAVGPIRGFGVRLALTGDDRITFRVRQRDRDGVGTGAHTEDVFPQDIVDRPRLLEILTTYFRFPFESTDDFTVFSGGSGGVYAEVPVFSGTIRWPRRISEPSQTSTAAQPTGDWPPYHETPLFITESDPQYLCTSIVLDGAP